MSIPTIYTDVINGLLQKSVSKEVIWDVTTDTNIFVVYFENSSFSLHRHSNYNDSWFSVDIIDNKGDKIDGFVVSSEDDGDEWNTMDELFSIARRSALSIDNTIQGMLNELSKNGTIGQKRMKDNTIDNGFRDDIPF
jgi:hypothetical protein